MATYSFSRSSSNSTGSRERQRKEWSRHHGNGVGVVRIWDIDGGNDWITDYDFVDTDIGQVGGGMIGYWGERIWFLMHSFGAAEKIKLGSISWAFGAWAIPL